MDDQIYNGKLLSDYSLWDLGLLLKTFRDAEAKREEASKHPKFDIKNKAKYIGPMPPPNPNFLNLKNAVEAEIRKKQENA